MLDARGLRQRAAVLHALRQTFAGWGYLEVPTPVLVACPAVEPTLHAVQAGDGWLRTSPELALKRALASGLGRIYEIGPCLRERELSPWHGREFTMLEWYRAGAGLHDLMDEVEALVAASAHALGVEAPVSWRRVAFRDLFFEVTGCDAWLDPPEHISPQDPGDRDGAVLRRWVADVEPALRGAGAIFIHRWPASMAALSRILTTHDTSFSARFEAYIDGIELANAFLELREISEQRERLAATDAARIAQSEARWPIDERFVQAVGALPPSAGIALGVDRLVAVLAGWKSIEPGRVN